MSFSPALCSSKIFVMAETYIDNLRSKPGFNTNATFIHKRTA